MNTAKVADPHLKCFPRVFPAHTHAYHPGHHSPHGLLHPSGLYQGGPFQPRYLDLPPTPGPLSPILPCLFPFKNLSLFDLMDLFTCLLSEQYHHLHHSVPKNVGSTNEGPLAVSLSICTAPVSAWHPGRYRFVESVKEGKNVRCQ